VATDKIIHGHFDGQLGGCEIEIAFLLAALRPGIIGFGFEQSVQGDVFADPAEIDARFLRFSISLFSSG
jgi:hypothetical protein